MDTSNFTYGSVNQVLFDYWDNRIETADELKKVLKRFTKKELTDFIMEAQSKGVFAGYTSPQ